MRAAYFARAAEAVNGRAKNPPGGVLKCARPPRKIGRALPYRSTQDAMQFTGYFPGMMRGSKRGPGV
jgi:hypothetical protein